MFQPGCRCQDLPKIKAFAKTAIETASEYLEIIEGVSSTVNQLRHELPGPFENISQTFLPQGIGNNVEDPREMVQQLVTLCLKLSEQVKTLKANSKSLHQASEIAIAEQIQFATQTDVLPESRGVQTHTPVKEYEMASMVKYSKEQELMQTLQETQTELDKLREDQSFKSEQIQKFVEQEKEQQDASNKCRKELEAKTCELENLAENFADLVTNVNHCEVTIKAQNMKIENIRQWTSCYGKNSYILCTSLVVLSIGIESIILFG